MEQESAISQPNQNQQPPVPGRKEQERLQRQKAGARRKIRNYATAIVIVAAVAVGIYLLVRNSAPQSGDFSSAVPILENTNHVPIGSASPEMYNSNPPTSGPHYATPARPGFREDTIEDGYIIHSMEHGLVWISYHPRIGEEAEKLQDATGPLTVITIREANDTDIALAAWGRLDKFNLEDGTIDDDDLQRIDDFVKRWSNKGPEFIPAGRHGGI